MLHYFASGGEKVDWKRIDICPDLNTRKAVIQCIWILLYFLNTNNILAKEILVNHKLTIHHVSKGILQCFPMKYKNFSFHKLVFYNPIKSFSIRSMCVPLYMFSIYYDRVYMSSELVNNAISVVTYEGK